MTKKLFTLLLFLVTLLVTLPLIMTHIALNRVLEDYTGSFKFAHFFYQADTGVKMRIYDIHLTSAVEGKKKEEANSVFIKTLDASLDFTNMSLHKAEIFGLDCSIKGQQYFEKGSAEINISPLHLKVSGQAYPFNIETRGPATFHIDTLHQEEISGEIALSLPAFSYQDFDFSFHPINLNFDKNALWLCEQKVLSLNGSFIHLHGVYEFDREHIDFTYSVDQLQTAHFSDISWILETTLRGQGKGSVDWSKDLQYQCHNSLKGDQGLFFPFNPETASKNVNLINLFSKKDEEDPDTLFSFDSSLIDFTYENGDFTVDNFELKRHNDTLNCHGHYLFDESYQAKVVYKKFGSLSPLSFSIKGQGENYNIYLDSTDILNAVPELLLPNINKLFNS